MSKVAKGKGKTCGKMEKPKNVVRNQTTNRYTAFKITIRGYLRFCIKASSYIKKRKPRLTSCLAHFVGNLDARVELRQYQSLSLSNFFLFLTVVLFLSSLDLFFLFFSPRTFFLQKCRNKYPGLQLNFFPWYNWPSCWNGDFQGSFITCNFTL